MAGIKIVDLPAVGRDLIGTDLLELSLAGGTGSRKITGQQIINASKLSVGTTPVVGGTVGRILFEGAGNVLQENSSLFWDNTNSRLGIGTSTPANTLDVAGSVTSGFDAIRFKGQYSAYGYLATSNSSAYLSSGAGVTGSFIELNSTNLGLKAGTTAITFAIASEIMRINNNNNVLIGTTTDAGYKLDVNGTARVQNTLKFSNGITASTQNGYFEGNTVGNITNTTAVFNFQHPTNATSGTMFQFSDGLNTGYVTDLYGNKDVLRIYSGFKNPNSSWNYTDLKIDPTYQGVGNASLIRGIYYNPTNSLTGTYTHRAIETTAGNVIFNGGSVGIGTSTPVCSLDVTGNIALNHSGTRGKYYFSRDAVVSYPTKYYIDGGDHDVNVVMDTGNYISLHDNAQTTFNTSWSFGFLGGNVLIGTTTDAGYKLDVNGTARVSGQLNVLNSSSNGIVITNGPSIEFWSAISRITLTRASNNSLEIGGQSGFAMSTVNAGTLIGGSSSADLNASAQLQVNSTTKGFLPPRMTQTQRNAIASPAIGLEIYQTDATEGKYIYKSSGWTYIG